MNKDYEADISRKAAREILSRFLGISLPTFAVVHHRDENPFNNALTNLQIVTKAEHAKIHSGKDQRYNRQDTLGKILPKGITYDSARGNFKCSIRVGTIRYQARVGTLENALEWRRLMEELYWKDPT